MTHKIYIRKYNDLLDIASEWKDLTLGAMVKPEDKEKGVDKIKNSIAALETYGALIISNKDSNEHPNRRFINWLRKLLKLNRPGFGYRVIDVKKIPKGFDKEGAKRKIVFEIKELT